MQSAYNYFITGNRKSRGIVSKSTFPRRLLNHRSFKSIDEHLLSSSPCVLHRVQKLFVTNTGPSSICFVLADHIWINLDAIKSLRCLYLDTLTLIISTSPNRQELRDRGWRCDGDKYVNSGIMKHWGQSWPELGVYSTLPFFLFPFLQRHPLYTIYPVATPAPSLPFSQRCTLCDQVSVLLYTLTSTCVMTVTSYNCWKTK